jgi:hypothetical protein
MSVHDVISVANVAADYNRSTYDMEKSNILPLFPDIPPQFDSNLSEDQWATAWAAWVNSRAFLKSIEWAKARWFALTEHGFKCCKCGRTASDNIKLNVDHIMPRRDYPHLALDLDNLRVLCSLCNWGRGNHLSDIDLQEYNKAA